MPNKMERFTQRSRRALSLAQEAAEKLQHNYIGTEHLLLGLIREEGGVAGRVLHKLDLEQRQMEELVESLTRASTTTTITALDLSPGTKRVLELAVDEARRMGHHYIGTEHLLLALVRQSEGVAIEALKRLEVTPEEVRRETQRVLQEAPGSRSGPPEEVRRETRRVLQEAPGSRLKPTPGRTTIESVVSNYLHKMRLEASFYSKFLSESQLIETKDVPDKAEFRIQIESLSKALSEVAVALAAIEQKLSVDHTVKRETPEISIKIIDNTNGESMFEFKTSLIKLQTGFLTLMDVASGDTSGKIELEDDNVRIEITFTETSE